MNTLNKIQNLPLKTRKIILWTIIIIASSALLFLWLGNVKKAIREFKKGGKENFIESVNFPSFEKNLEESGVDKGFGIDEKFKQLEEQLKQQDEEQ